MSTVRKPEATNRFGLTEKEIEVLQVIADAQDHTEAAKMLGVHCRTVGYHMGNMYLKLGCISRIQAVVIALREGIIK